MEEVLLHASNGVLSRELVARKDEATMLWIQEGRCKICSTKKRFCL